MKEAFGRATVQLFDQLKLEAPASLTVGDIQVILQLLPFISPVETLPTTWSIPPQNMHFIGRTELLVQMATHLGQNTFMPLVLTACHGLGGVGKTQLALEYVWQHYSNYQGVCWFRADSLDTLLQEYIRLGEELRIIKDRQCPPEEQARVVKHALENQYHSWLLVYDNVPRYEDIARWLPTRGGALLFTSRHTRWPDTALTLTIDVFTWADARAYVEALTGSKCDDMRDTLIETLGRLPLALAQACAYIAQTSDCPNISAYLPLYEASRVEFLGNPARLKLSHPATLTYAPYNPT
jgi:hypothetical protein